MIKYSRKNMISGLAAGALILVGVAAAAADPSPVADGYNRASVVSQKVESDAAKKVGEANSLYGEGKYREAIGEYLAAIKILETFRTPVFSRRIENCRRQISLSYYYMAREAVEQANRRAQVQDFEEAISLCREALEYYPEGAKEINRNIEFLERRLAAAKVFAETGPEAMAPERPNQEYQIQILLRQAQELSKAGSFHRAAQKYQDVLMIDPYSSVAINNLRAVNKRSRDYAEKRYYREHERLATEAEWRWAVPALPVVEPADVNVDGGPIEKTTTEDDINKKIRNIIIPRIDFEDVTISTAIKFLQEESKRNDPEGLGVNIFLRRENSVTAAAAAAVAAAGSGEMMMDGPPPPPGAAAPAPAAGGDEDGEGEIDPDANAQKISILITQRSLFDALRSICEAANLRMRIERYAVVIAPESVPLDDFETNIYPIGITSLSNVDVTSQDALKASFRSMGVRFPAGSQIVFDSRISRLIVTNTIENLRILENIIAEITQEEEPMVEIVAKFIEVTQDDLKELGFDYTISYNADNYPYANNGAGATIPDNASHRLSFGRSMTGLMRHYEDEQGVTNRQFSVNGVMGGENGFTYGVNVFAANKLGATDTLASPRVTTLDGQMAWIRMIREVYYPDAEWDESEENKYPMRNSMLWVTRFSPFPQFDEAKELGVDFRVTPRVDKANRVIELTIIPVLSSFVGELVYEQVTSDGQIEKETRSIIAKRTLETKVSIYNGHPVVIGGVIEEEAIEQLDKIPILGDLPIIGRLFQSRYNTTKKKHLLIFVSAKIIKPDGSPFYPADPDEPKLYPYERGLPEFGRLE